MTLPDISGTKAFLAASHATLPALKSEVVAGAGYKAWAAKVRTAIIGGLIVAAGAYLGYIGVRLLLLDHDIGKWLVAGGVLLGITGATIWDSELVGGALKSVPGWIAAGITAIWGAVTNAKRGDA